MTSSQQYILICIEIRQDLTLTTKTSFRSNRDNPFFIAHPSMYAGFPPCRITLELSLIHI